MWGDIDPIAPLTPEELKVLDQEEWTTQDGRTVLITEMENAHLLNAIAYMRRNVMALMLREVSALDTYLSTDPPDGAQMAALNAAEGLADMDEDDFLETNSTYQALLKEARKRDLTWGN